MVFVTGATGLLGGYLLLELTKRNQTIIALKRENSNLFPIQQLFEEFSTKENFDKINWVEGDLFDIPFLTETLKEVQTIYHLAAFVSFDDRQRKQLHEANVDVTEFLVNLAIELQIPAFVYVSSIATLDKSEIANEIDENAIWNSDLAHSEYAISKKKAEMIVWRASQENVNVLIVHPSIIVGSLDGKRESENLFKLNAYKTAYSTLGKTGFVDVRNVAFALVELVQQKCWNQNFILNADNKSFSEIAQFLRNKWELSSPKIISKSKLKWIYQLSKLSSILGGKSLSKASFHGLTEEVNYQNQKVKSTINIEFISIEEALNFHSERWKTKTQN